MSNNSNRSLATMESLPSVFDQLEGTLSVVGPSQEPVPFVHFASPKSGKWATLSATLHGLKDGEPILLLPPPQTPIRLQPFRFMILTAVQFWAKLTNDFQLAAVKFSKPSVSEGLKENVETVILVHLPDRVVPARCQFSGPKTGGVHPALAALEEAKTAAWAERGEAYKLTLRATKPWARFVATAALAGQRTSRSSGFTYTPMESRIDPATEADWSLLAKFFRDEGAEQAMLDVVDSFNRRMAEARAREVK